MAVESPWRKMNPWNRTFHTIVCMTVCSGLGMAVAFAQPDPDSQQVQKTDPAGQPLYPPGQINNSSDSGEPIQRGAQQVYPPGPGGNQDGPASDDSQPYNVPQQDTRPFNPWPHYYPPQQRQQLPEGMPQPYSAPQGFQTRRPANYQEQGIVYQRSNSAIIPQGIMLPITLDTTISTSTAKPGDYVQAHVNQNVSLGGTHYLPGGTQVAGQIARPDGKREKSEELTMVFTQMKLPTGIIIPLAAHLVGRIGDYVNRENPRYNESMGMRLAQAGMHSGVGVGLGGIMGSAEGAVATGGRGFSAGEFMGAGMGGTVGALSSLLWRHASPSSSVLLHSGTQMQLQLDQEVDVPDPHSRSNYQQQNSGQY